MPCVEKVFFTSEYSSRYFRRGERVKDVLRDRIKLLTKHDWSQFKLRRLQLKPMNQRLEFSDEDIKK